MVWIDWPYVCKCVQTGAAAKLNRIETDLFVEMLMDDPLFGEFCIAASQVCVCMEQRLLVQCSIRVVIIAREMYAFHNPCERFVNCLLIFLLPGSWVCYQGSWGEGKSRSEESRQSWQVLWAGLISHSDDPLLSREHEWGDNDRSLREKKYESSDPVVPRKTLHSEKVFSCFLSFWIHLMLCGSRRMWQPNGGNQDFQPRLQKAHFAWRIRFWQIYRREALSILLCGCRSLPSVNILRTWRLLSSFV